jgi:peptide subunit release factor 1 (eRF1)
MATGPATAASPLQALMQRLAGFTSTGADLISLYLDLRSDPRGGDTHEVFLRRAFADVLEAEARGADTAMGRGAAFRRIQQFLADDVPPSAQGAAIFTTAGDDGYFEALAIDVPLDAHQLFVGPVPHLYPLARLVDQYPRYAALLIDSNHARIVVFALGAIEARTEISGVKTRRHSMGGWSQARYQRRTENIHLRHVKDVVDALDRVVRDEAIGHVIVAGDAGIVAKLREQLPAPLAEKVVDALRFDRHADEAQIVDEALAALRRKDAANDAERVREVLDAWRAGGLGVAGPEATLRALQLGQVDELLITASPGTLKPVQTLPDEAVPATMASSSGDSAGLPQVRLADELVTRATQTGASVRMIEDAELLRANGGVAAALRFRI